jgi:hypothetical protein
VCQARRPLCERCVLTELCEYYGREVAPSRRSARRTASAANRGPASRLRRGHELARPVSRKRKKGLHDSDS